MLFQNIYNFNFSLFYDPGLSKKWGKLQIYRYKYIYFAKNGYVHSLQHNLHDLCITMPKTTGKYVNTLLNIEEIVEIVGNISIFYRK